jgi:hypothetical protein
MWSHAGIRPIYEQWNPHSEPNDFINRMVSMHLESLWQGKLSVPRIRCMALYLQIE